MPLGSFMGGFAQSTMNSLPALIKMRHQKQLQDLQIGLKIWTNGYYATPEEMRQKGHEIAKALDNPYLDKIIDVAPWRDPDFNHKQFLNRAKKFSQAVASKDPELIKLTSLGLLTTKGIDTKKFDEMRHIAGFQYPSEVRAQQIEKEKLIKLQKENKFFQPKPEYTGLDQLLADLAQKAHLPLKDVVKLKTSIAKAKSPIDYYKAGEKIVKARWTSKSVFAKISPEENRAGSYNLQLYNHYVSKLGMDPIEAAGKATSEVDDLFMAGAFKKENLQKSPSTKDIKSPSIEDLKNKHKEKSLFDRIF